MKKKFGEVTLGEVKIMCGSVCKDGDCPEAFADLSDGCVFEEDPAKWPVDKEIDIPDVGLEKEDR